MAANTYLDGFMKQFPYEALTFDDVSLVTQYADFLPDSADISTRLTSRIRMNIPFLSAAMDTVTESRMAIAMAMLGGIGVIHKNLLPENQVEEVAKVKQHLNGLIRNPVTFVTSQSIAEIQSICDEKGYKFHGYPILDGQGRLAGMLTSTDLRYAITLDAPIETMMTPVSKLVTAPPATGLEEAFRIMKENKIGKLPLVDSENRLVGLYSFTDLQTLVGSVDPLYNRDAQHRLRVAAAISGGDHLRAGMLASAGVDVFVVDSAHGHSKGILDTVKWLAEHFPEIDIIAGNVATAEGALALRDAGAHAVKVGIGPGSICTTRVVCGIGVPQITAVYNAAKALDGSIPVIADGGIRLSGDVPKALTAGASSVMLGSILAATEESPGEKIISEGRHYVVYRGMGSLSAMQSFEGSRKRYGQAARKMADLVPEGIEGIVPYAGTVKKVMTQFCGGLRSSLGYNGSRSIAELQEKGKFVRVTGAGMREAHPHDIKITKEAPNYRS